MRRIVQVTLGLAAAVTLTAGLSACSSSKSKSSGGGPSSSGSSGSSSGKTIKVLTMGQYQASQFSLPEMEDATKAAINAANASGGINGVKIELTTCNDQGDPNIAAKCARQAVTDKDVAVLGSISLYDTGVTPLLEAAHIPLIGNLPLGDTDFTSSISYPISGGSPSQFVASGLALTKKGCTSVGIVSSSDNSGSQVSAKLVATGVKAGGGTVVKTIGVPSTAPDLAPTVSSLLQAGAKCVGMVIPAATQSKFVIAARQSSDPQLLMSGTIASAPLSVISAAKSAFEGVLLPAADVIPSASATPNFVAQLTAENPKAEQSEGAEIAWSAATAFVQIAKAIKGDITGQTLIDQLNKTTALKLETYPDAINFTQPNSNPQYKRLFNTKAILYVVKNGAYVQDQAAPIDVASALK